MPQPLKNLFPNLHHKVVPFIKLCPLLHPHQELLTGLTMQVLATANSGSVKSKDILLTGSSLFQVTLVPGSH